MLGADDSVASTAPRVAHRLSGLFLLSLATLMLELALTRVLSVALWYHFGFLVISTALLGYGAAGVTLTAWPRLRERAALDPALGRLALGFAVATLASFWLMQRIPFDPFSMLADRRQLLWMPLYDLALAAPFYASGLAIALLFTRGAKTIGRLYAFDLAGAGLGCALIAVVMPAVGGAGSVVAAAAIGALAAVAFCWREARQLGIVALVAAALCAGFSPFAERLLPIAINPGKRPPVERTPIYTAWNTFSRIDVYETAAAEEPHALRRRFLIDAGTAATGMVDLRPNVRAYLAQHTDDRDFDSGVAYVGRVRPRILILGSGGGTEVVDGLHFGASSITAVEINPIINDVVSGRMRDFWGDLFAQPEVHLVTDEARSYVRRSRDRYDAILSVHTISNAAVASGALSLAENYVLTCEAFTDYLDHLAPGGAIFFTRPEAQIARLFATAREAFARRGLPSPAANIFAWRSPSSLAGRPSFSAGFVLRTTPLAAEDIERMKTILRIGEADKPGGAPSAVLYSPFDRHPESLFARLLDAPDVRTVYASEAALLAPATDDRPFFNQHVRWSKLTPAAIADVFRQRGYLAGRLALEDRPIAEITLLAVLAQSILVAGLLILLPLWRSARAGLAGPGRFRFLLYFAGLGLGFIFIEIALLQRFTLFLGQPVYTLAVVLASLLACSGLGAWFSGRLQRPPRAAVRLAVPAVLAALLFEALAAPAIFAATLGLPLALRVLIAVLLIAPLGVALGMPFPSGLRAVDEESPALVPWAWGVNCFFTVIGSVTALILGMAIGFNAVLTLAAVCYLVCLGALASRAKTRDTAEA